MKRKREEKPDLQPYTGKTYAYIGIALTAVGAVALVLALTVGVLGVYALIASVLLELGALTFINIQKKKNDFIRLKYIKICAYVLLAITLAVFIGGIIWSSL